MDYYTKLNTLVASREARICVVGLGYVGLPLAVEFGKQFRTFGFDINEDRLAALRSGIDSTCELGTHDLAEAKYLSYTKNSEDVRSANVFIVTVPTPINRHKQPDLTPLIKASEMIGSVLKRGDIVIYESTVYPGATEEECVPVLEHFSELKFNEEFFVGYSPERINPGDKEHSVTTILKVTSGSTAAAADIVDDLYQSIITVGTYKASSIMVAEAAKVIENTQRDVNIGLINELALIFNKLGIDTEEVLEAAGTKWNFLPFRPGLVGGHCIGVDPYYLTHKAQSLGLHPEMILAGRRVNDAMGNYVASHLVKKMLDTDIPIKGAQVLVMGFAFKEDCPDVRNTKVIDVVLGLEEYGIHVDCYDPWVDEVDARREYGIDLISAPVSARYDAVLVAVAHKEFRKTSVDILRSYCKTENVIFDLKYIYPSDKTDLRI